MLLEIRSMALNKKNPSTDKLESKWKSVAVEEHKVYMAAYALS